MESKTTTDPLVGTVVDSNFEVVELIGEGAMGKVYAARQRSLDKMVAIKVLHRHLANDPKIKRRFHREARATSRLSHPNSVQIIDMGEAGDGTLYIAMELLDGDDLLTLIQDDEPMSPRRVMNLFGQVLDALAEAHLSGIIHRDLKPENVVVVEDRDGNEVVKVCDFGIAKIQESEGGTAITMTGFVCGTPEYMAPEQARGDKIDPRADVYAAGCVLYQMLTRTVPFEAATALGIITKHLTEEPEPPSKRAAERHIPVELERVCLTAMSKDPASRYAGVPAMKQALEEAVAALGDTADLPLGTVRPTTEAPRETPLTTTADALEAPSPSEPKTTHGLVPLVIVGLGVLLAVGIYLPFRPASSGSDGAMSGDRSKGPPSSATAPLAKGRTAVTSGVLPDFRAKSGKAAAAGSGSDEDGASDDHAARGSAVHTANAGHSDNAVHSDNVVHSDNAVHSDDVVHGDNAVPSDNPLHGNARHADDATKAVTDDGTERAVTESRRGANGPSAAQRSLSENQTAAAAERGWTRPPGSPSRAVQRRAANGGARQQPSSASSGSAMNPSEATAESFPENAGAIAYDEGRRLFLANDLAASIRKFEEAARLMPKNADVQKQLGRAYMRAGERDKGVAAYRRYLELAPGAADRSIIEAILSGS